MTYHLYRTKHQKVSSARSNRLDILRHIAARMSSQWVIRDGMQGPIILCRHKNAVAALLKANYNHPPLAQSSRNTLDDSEQDQDTYPSRETGPSAHQLR